MSALEHLTFDTTGLVQHRDDPNERIWLASDNDVILLQYFGGAPPLHADLHDIDRIRAAYRSITARAGGAILRVDIVQIAGFDVIVVLIKIPQKPSGMMYIASLTVPFRDFSYVVKVQCEETGMTGLRDTVIFAELARTDEITFDPESGQPTNWFADPYRASDTGPVARNRSEDAIYDQRFPGHPLSRARRTLQHIEATLRFSGDLKREARFG